MQSSEQARPSCPVSPGPLRGQFDSPLKFKTEGASQAVLAVGLTSKKEKKQQLTNIREVNIFAPKPQEKKNQPKTGAAGSSFSEIMLCVFRQFRRVWSRRKKIQK